jgi:hypothetical protein
MWAEMGNGTGSDLTFGTAEKNKFFCVFFRVLRVFPEKSVFLKKADRVLIVCRLCLIVSDRVF